MKKTLVSAFVIAVSCAAALCQERPRASQEADDFNAGYRIGVKEADDELKGDRATIYEVGLRMEGEFLDQSTGLPCTSLGCGGTNRDAGRVEGHNKRIEQFIADHGLPNNSFKKWEKELFDLKDYIAKRQKSEKPIPLKLGSSAVTSPDGRFRVRIIQSEKKEDGRSEKSLSIAIAPKGATEKLYEVYFPGTVELFWGPRNSNFAVFRIGSAPPPSLEALDLTRGKLLRKELLDH